MTEQVLDPTVVPAVARYCPLCEKRLASMNHGIHCFACADTALERQMKQSSAPKQTRRSKGVVNVVRKPILNGTIGSTNALCDFFASI